MVLLPMLNAHPTSLVPYLGYLMLVKALKDDNLCFSRGNRVAQHWQLISSYHLVPIEMICALALYGKPTLQLHIISSQTNSKCFSHIQAPSSHYLPHADLLTMTSIYHPRFAMHKCSQECRGRSDGRHLELHIERLGGGVLYLAHW